MPTDVILAEFFGDCARGIEWLRDFTHLLAHMRLCDARTRKDGSPYAGFDIEPIHSPDHAVAREVAYSLVDLLSLLERHDNEIVIRGRRGFWGKQHRKVLLTQEERDARLYEREMALDSVGAPISRAKAPPEIEREYIPAGGSGLAGRWQCSVSSVGRRASLFKHAHFIGSTQPKADAADAVLPRGADYPYSKWRILRALPRCVLHTLRWQWNELTEAPPAPAPTPSTAPRAAPAPAPERATGPPPAPEPAAPDDAFIASTLAQVARNTARLLRA